MKVLVITNHSYMLWQFRRELLQELQKHCDVVIATPFSGHEDDFSALGFKMIPIEMNRRGEKIIEELRLIKKYKKIISEEKPDKVITISIKPNCYAGHICRQKHIPYFSIVQGLGTAFQSEKTAFVATLLYKWGTKKAQKLIFENTGNRDEFINRGIVSKERAVVMPGAGVNLDFFSYSNYPSEENGLRFLYLGRIMKEKGIEELFDAWTRLKKKYGDKVKFDVVGFYEDGYSSRMEKLVGAGIAEFYGFQDDPRPYYAAAHCVILPSWHEGMSNVLLEASATGRAIITTDIPGCREALDEGKNGFLTQKQSVDSIENAIEKFIALTTEDRKAFGIYGRQKMEASFDRKNVINGMLDLILS